MQLDSCNRVNIVFYPNRPPYYDYTFFYWRYR
jgi:hypothetical protein